jgi:NAD(P)-dependent dehydrogenase (short-subunit alcohol dehydrogenase family)
VIIKKGVLVSTWLITGCSTGLGRAFAKTALDYGHNVVATARDAATLGGLARDYSDAVLTLTLDVTDHRQIREVVARANDRFSAIGVLVNNAGYGYRAAVEEGESDAIDGLFATNFFGPVAMIQAVLPGRKEHDASDGRQPGDPAKAADALIRAVEDPQPPFMLVLGPEALESFCTAITDLTTDLDAWKQTSLSTDY